MLATFVKGAPLEWLLDPEGEPWRATHPEKIALMGTPLALQPTAAIRVAWRDKHIGAVDRVAVAAVHNGQTLAFRLEWADPTENRELGDTTAFPDAAAVLLPSIAGAPLITMGGQGAPVNAWYWRADDDGGGRQVLAEGIGTTRTVDTSLVRGHGQWKEGRWRVVIGRALRVNGPEHYAQLEPGQTTQFGVAIWEGSHGERGGIKSFSGNWRELRLAPAASSGRS